MTCSEPPRITLGQLAELLAEDVTPVWLLHATDEVAWFAGGLQAWAAAGRPVEGRQGATVRRQRHDRGPAQSGTDDPSRTRDGGSHDGPVPAPTQPDLPRATPDPHRNDPTTEQHHLAWSILLHLLPGIALTAFIVLAAPVVRSFGFPSVFALFVGIPLVIVPIELGILLAHAKRTTGRFSLGGTVVYRNRLPRRRLIGLTLGLVAWFSSWLVLATAVLDEWIAARLFGWIPEAILQFSQVDQAGESAPLGAVLVVIVVAVVFNGVVFNGVVFNGVVFNGVVFNGVVGPGTEELHLRGYLLPRIDRLGRWAPVRNTVLFSLYHLWAPGQNLTRVISLLPMVWLSWRSRSTQLAIATHVTINLLFLLGLMALVVGSAA